jgi:hypothetical protein
VLVKWCFRSLLFEFLVYVVTLSVAQITYLEWWDDLVVRRDVEERNRDNISEFYCTIDLEGSCIIPGNHVHELFAFIYHS